MNAGDNDSGRVAGSFTFTAQCGEGKQLTFSGYILAEDDEASANKRLDMAAKVVQRQQTIAEIPLLEAKLKGIADHKAHLIRTIEDLGKKDRLTSQEKMTLQNAQQNIQKHTRDMVEGQATIEKVRAQLAA